MSDKKKSFWKMLRLKSSYFENFFDESERKDNGIFYTDLNLTDSMMRELVLNLLNGDKPVTEYTFLEPCAGVGNFVFSYLKALSFLPLSKNDHKKILSNIYVADVNPFALAEYCKMLRRFAKIYWKIFLDDNYFRTHIGKGMLLDFTEKELRYIPITENFPKKCRYFDIVVGNPPYRNLKEGIIKTSSKKILKTNTVKQSNVKKILRENFKYSIDGTLNLYKLFLEEILESYTSKDAFISLLVPSTVLSDMTSRKLRMHILSNSSLLSAKFINEKNNFINAEQALCTLLIKKGEQTKNILVTKDYCNVPNEEVSIKVEDVLNEHIGNSVIAINAEEYKILRRLKKYPTVKDLPYIINLRGELDLTTYKSYIISEHTNYPLIRGKDVVHYDSIKISKNEYVLEDFLKVTLKEKYIRCKRIVCQQVSNINKKKRITFSVAPKNVILGNSCNFISVEENDKGIDIYTLLGLFNSQLINRYFKLFSCNNHVSNYEIDSFPVPVDSPYLPKITELVKRYLDEKEENLLAMIEKNVESAYEISSIIKV